MATGRLMRSGTGRTGGHAGRQHEACQGQGGGPLQTPRSPDPSRVHQALGNRRLEDGHCYLTSAIRASPTMTSGIPLVNSRTLFLTQSAACSFGGKCLVRAVKYADGDQDVWAAIKQVIASEPVYLSHHGHEALSHTSSKFLRRTASHVISSDAGEHRPALGRRLRNRCHCLSARSCSIARSMPLNADFQPDQTAMGAAGCEITVRPSGCRTTPVASSRADRATDAATGHGWLPVRLACALFIGG